VAGVAGNLFVGELGEGDGVVECGWHSFPEYGDAGRGRKDSDPASCWTDPRGLAVSFSLPVVGKGRAGMLVSLRTLGPCIRLI
jgi:hypothetical protein